MRSRAHGVDECTRVPNWEAAFQSVIEVHGLEFCFTYIIYEATNFILEEVWTALAGVKKSELRCDAVLFVGDIEGTWL